MNEQIDTEAPHGSDPLAVNSRTKRLSLAVRATALLLSVVAILGAIVLLRGRAAPAPFAAGGTGALDHRALVVGQPAPDFVLMDVNGHAIRLSDLRGQVVLVNFWATWCIPCRQELPAIEQVYSEQRDRGFTALEVNEQESPADVESFASQIGATPPIVLDSAASVLAQYRFKGLPDSVLVDPQGTVRSVSYGPLSRETLLREIDSAHSGSLH